MEQADDKKKRHAPESSGEEVPPTRVYNTGYGTTGKDESYTESHPSYGMIRVHRTMRGGGGMKLFGSPVESPSTIRFEVCEAVLNHDLSRDWYYARKPLILAEMSPAQFAELITNFNTEGVPCTLRRVMGESRPDCPQRHLREEIVNNFRGQMRQLAEGLKAATAEAAAILDNKDKKNLTNADRDTLRPGQGDPVPDRFGAVHPQPVRRGVRQDGGRGQSGGLGGDHHDGPLAGPGRDGRAVRRPRPGRHAVAAAGRRDARPDRRAAGRGRGGGLTG